MTVSAETIANALMLAQRMIDLENMGKAPMTSDFILANSVRAQCSTVLQCIRVPVKGAA